MKHENLTQQGIVHIFNLHKQGRWTYYPAVFYDYLWQKGVNVGTIEPFMSRAFADLVCERKEPTNELMILRGKGMALRAFFTQISDIRGCLPKINLPVYQIVMDI